MESPLVTSLIVSGLGMLMLLVAMCVLYGLMYGMTALLKDGRERPTDRRPDPGPSRNKNEAQQRERAAVIAVALARAEAETSGVEKPRADEQSSAWWTLHHQRQLTRDRRTVSSGDSD